jgi:hypothetical protein
MLTELLMSWVIANPCFKTLQNLLEENDFSVLSNNLVMLSMNVVLKHKEELIGEIEQKTNIKIMKKSHILKKNLKRARQIDYCLKQFKSLLKKNTIPEGDVVTL